MTDFEILKISGYHWKRPILCVQDKTFDTAVTTEVRYNELLTLRNHPFQKKMNSETFFKWKKNKVNTTPIGRSIAVWGEEVANKKPACDRTTIQVHFNYWHLKSQKYNSNDVSDFFDIGIMANSCHNLSSVWIYIPAIFKISDFEDLGHLFSNPVIASGIFNESLSATIPPNSSHITLNNGDEVYSRVYVFPDDIKGHPSQSELKIVSEGNGTLVEICRRAIKNACTSIAASSPVYFRIRVKVPKSVDSPFSRKMKPADSWLLSSFEYTEFLDFRLNEARNLPVSITQRMRLGQVPVLRVDYLLVVGDSADVAGGVDSDKKRLLETELWQEYAKSTEAKPLSDGMVIHHWKKVSDEEKGIGDFSAFIKLKFRRSGASLIWRYLLVVALIGCLGSLLASTAWTRFEMEKMVKSSK